MSDDLTGQLDLADGALAQRGELELLGDGRSFGGGAGHDEARS